MLCSRQLHAAPPLIPVAIRDRFGALLQGPPRGPRLRRQAACLFALGRIGDFLLTFSAQRLLLGHFGPEACTVVVPAHLEALAAREFPGVRRLALPAEATGLLRQIVPIWWRERRKFAADHFTHRICLSHQRPLYYEVALSWADADHDTRLLPETYPQAPADGLCTELLGHWRVVENVLGRPVQREEILPRFHSLVASDDGRLVVYPFSLDPVRSLAPETVVRVLQLWRERSRAPVVLGGSPGDRSLLEACAGLARAAGLDAPVIETPAGLDGLLQHVARAGAVYAGDSAAAHIAAALDKPSVVQTSRSFHGYAQPWGRSGRQQVFLHEAAPEQVAASLRAL